MDNVQAVILAGGLGTRLRPVVDDRPKVVAEVKGRPFLTFIFDQLIRVGIRSVVLCTGYMGAQVQEIFGDVYEGLDLRYSHESEPMGTAGALRFALPALNSQTILVMNGDSFCQDDLGEFYRWHCTHGARASMMLSRVSDTSRFGRVRVNNVGKLQSFEEKGEHSGPGWINAGIYLFAREMIEGIPPHKCISLEREIFPTWIGQGFWGYKGTGNFLDIGTPEDYAVAENRLVD